jgi:plasmid maintenance system antidote protein VapI
MAIDTAWFHKQLDMRGESVRGLARFMGVDPSAVSRMLKGERKMSAEEQDQISQFLGINIEEIAMRRRGEPAAFRERKQAAYAAEVAPSGSEFPPVKMFTEDDIIYRDGKRYMETKDGELLELHPAYGCMKGTMLIPDDLDLTAPADPDWGKVYEND